ncbi:olfactory receptor 6X1-like [Podarcis raffonei]|uniref:olfactory receptor 6X1-like n=1 Tax=Podarcis raffonei TaxID=65483 RepID=UPI0023295614|nr:olfactory receptor 6X1-like [Podarcis raffonei]
MDLTNCSRVTEFILLGFPHFQGMDIFLFVVILLLYLLSLTGNGLIIVIMTVDHRLQKPMYFFLSNLSIIEIGHTTVFMPKMLVNFLSAKNTICFHCCMAQSFFYFLFGVTEFFILSIMSFDGYLAICHPLRYPTLMTSQVCLKLALAAWLAGFFSVIFQVLKAVRLPFCSSNIVHHFFCDVGALLKIAGGGDTKIIEALGFAVAVAVILSSLLLTVVIYIFIISTILCITSSSGQQKAFSTCASHLTVVSILYGSVLFIYLRPSVKGSSLGNNIVSVLNMIVIPVLNPFIYTIRNNEVKDALRKALGRKTFAVSKSL